MSTTKNATIDWLIFRYEDVECEEKLWWVFLLSCAAFPVTLLTSILLFRVCRNTLGKYRRRLGYRPVTQTSISVVDVDGDESDINGGVRQPPPDEREAAALEKKYWSEDIRRAASEIVSAQSPTGKIAVSNRIVIHFKV